VERIVGDIPYSDGAHETVAELKQAGISVGLVSSGISMLASRAARELGFDFAIANRLLHQEGKLTGEVVVEVPLEKKAAIMQEMAERLGVPFTSCATIGDTAYDLPLTSALRIAFKPRDVQTARQADAVVRGSNLRGVLEHIIQRS
jgi:phosphoserine phosphatase